jgi:signal transduction histidine kinase
MSADLQHPAERLQRRGTLLAVAFLALAAVGLGVGAWQLARSQSHDRADLRSRYASRAGVATALIDSLFRVAFTQQSQQAAQRFSGHVDRKSLGEFAKRNQVQYAAVLSQNGTVIAASPGAPPSPGQSVTMRAVTKGVAVSDLLSTPAGQVIESGVRYPVAHHARVLVSASPVAVFRSFLAGSLRPLVPVEGGDAYVLDGQGMMLASISADRPKRPPAAPAMLVRASRQDRSGFYDNRGEQHYFASAPQPQTPWRIVLSAPTNSLYKPASGVSRWLPWVVIGLLGVALAAIAVLVRRAIGAAGEIATANQRLERSQERLREHAAELRRANTELQRSNAELEQFAYVASHDLSAPLRAVAGFSQLLAVRYRGRLDSSADEFITHMQEGVDRMQRIIDDLLAYSRVERTTLAAEDVELEGVVDEVVRVLEPEIAERGATVTNDPLPNVCGDRGQIAQLLQNLIANGLKFTAEGVSPRVHVSAEAHGGRWRIQVRDNGIGIAPDHAARVFEMFHRLHSADEYPGTGIGLAICKKIVERHGGEIAIASAPEGGSVVTFDLPAEVAREGRIERESAAT